MSTIVFSSTAGRGVLEAACGRMDGGDKRAAARATDDGVRRSVCGAAAGVHTLRCDDVPMLSKSAQRLA